MEVSVFLLSEASTLPQKILESVRYYTIWSKKRFILWVARLRALITIFLAPHHRLFGRQSSTFPA